ncbi:MAG: hypothetical protein IJP70_10585 [Bacteroidales bacterium]|nr:hypothetical protein [Bacteroidales bacterium]
MKQFKSIAWGMIALAGLASCDDTWEADSVPGDKSKDLWTVISQKQELSEFAKVLKEGGYDELLQSDGLYTVLAPTNTAMSAVFGADRESVPGAHIILLEYNKSTLDTMSTIVAYNGKQTSVSEVLLQSEEIICRNGILRFANAAVGHRLNIFEHLNQLKDQYQMAQFIIDQGDSVMDMDQSIQIAIDANNNPVYDTVMVYSNPILDAIPINNNDSMVNLVLLADTTFERLTALYWNYFKQNDGLHPEPNYVGWKIDSAATTIAAKTALVSDLVFHPVDDAEGFLPPSKYFVSTTDVKVKMKSGVATAIPACNGNVLVAGDVHIHMAGNKIKPVYIEGEDYIKHSSEYIFTRVNIHARGQRDVVLCGTDTLRPYMRYLLDSVGNVTSETEKVYRSSTRFGYYGTSFASNTYPQVNQTRGGSYLSYTAPLYSCDYKIYMRSVDDRPTHVNPDTLCVDYEKYLADANYPCGGVIRNYQKLYLSQPGDNQISYLDDYTKSDFLINYSYSNYFQPNQRAFCCMVPYDPTVFDEGEFETVSATRLEELLGETNNFKHLGINAGYGVDDPNCEFPLIWCQTPNQAVMTQDVRTAGAYYYSGVTGICPNNNNTFLANGRPQYIKKDVFRCFYQGDASLFVTSGVFNVSNTANPSIGSIQPHGSIYLDYIHFEPVIEEDDEE